MTYSVWNTNGNHWDYYEAMGHLKSGVFAPNPTMPVGNRLGLSPEEASRALPRGAKHVGKGALARGMVATRKSALGAILGADTGTVTRLAVYGVIGYIVWTKVLAEPHKSKVRRALRRR